MEYTRFFFYKSTDINSSFKTGVLFNNHFYGLGII